MTVERATILVADDEPHIRRILQYLLEQAGYDVVVAADGEDALREVDRCAPDLVLLDVMMPRLDGFSVLRSIRSSLETARLPVILLTAKGESSEKVKGLRGGANDYVIKPFDQEELLLRIHNMLENARAQREANPLTGLPGNLAIAREASQRIASGEPFAIMYLDIDRFKSFNDTYGYARGDRAITLLSRVLCDAVRALGVTDTFVGHVGGDDFIVMTPTTQAEDLACRVVRDFDAGMPALHDAEDAARGYLEIRTRSGAAERVPLITLTVALITDAQGRFAHPAALSDTLAELKRFGKTMTGSVVVKERRGSAAPHVLVPDEEHAHDPRP